MSEATFYDRVTPALPAGEYQVIVQDTVTVAGETGAPASYAAAQRLRVAGPRAGLGPGDVVAMSPPPGASGQYDTWLPHVILAQRSLPWQVPVADSGPGAAGTAPLSWLALLLLTGEEIDVAGSPPASGTTGTQTVPLSACLTPPTGTLGPAATAGLTTLLAEQPTLTCTAVDISFSAFRAVAPELTELPYLAHARQVGTEGQEDLDVPAPGWYSVITGSRLPVGAADGMYIAHLVSLEGFSRHLPDSPAAVGFSLVRLISLASWTFISQAGNGDFAAIMRNLDLRPLTVPVTAGGADPATRLLTAAVAGGYTLLGYTTRLGEPTAAWYRGPLAPAPVAANPQPAYPAAAAALIYDPATGIFDTSYAAAWEAGRLLTLANGPVASSLAGWVNSAASAARQLASPDASARISAAAPRGGARQLAARRLIAGQVAPALLGRGTATPALGPRADPAGLRGRTLPGLLDPETLARIGATSHDPHRAVAAHALAGLPDRAPAPPGPGLTQPDRGSGPPSSGPGPGAENPAGAGLPLARHEVIRRLAADPAARPALVAQAGPVPDDVSAWLADLGQLAGVPFCYLVPDARMLPPESIRFFAVDPNWTAALTDGALSLAAKTAPAAAASAALRPAALAADRRVAAARARPVKATPPGAAGAAAATAEATTAAATAAGPAYSGFLLRSAAVSGWPGLAVTGYAAPPAATPLTLVRLERLAPTVLLAVFSGLVQHVELTEPAQHVHLGVTSATAPAVSLRLLNPAGAGTQVTGDLTAPVTLRPDQDGRTVIDTGSTLAAITRGLGLAVPPGPAGYGLQFIQSTASQAFTAAVTG